MFTINEYSSYCNSLINIISSKIVCHLQKFLIGESPYNLIENKIIEGSLLTLNCLDKVPSNTDMKTENTRET